MVMTEIPRQAVRLGFDGLRLPLTLAERAGLDVSGWPPVVAYEAVEAEAKKAVGRVLGDAELVREGELQAGAARRRARAVFLSREAETVSGRADERVEQVAGRAEEVRERAEQSAAARMAEIDRQEAQAREEVRRQAQAREAAARRAARSRQKALEAKEHKARLAQVDAESKALQKEQEALRAEKVVTEIDEHLENGRR